MRTYISYRTGMVVLLFSFLAVNGDRVWAGDPIIFSGDKAKAAPAPARKLDPEVMKSFDRFSTPPTFDNTLPQPDQDRRPDRNTIRRAKNARDEKRNWMWVDKGELQNRDEQKDAAGMHDALEEQNNSGDLTFSEKSQDRPGQPKERDQKQTRVPVHLLSLRQRQIQQAKDENGNHDTEASDSKDASKRPDSESQLGAHMSKELDLRKLLGPVETPGNDASKDLSLRDVLAPGRGRPMAERSQQMKDLLNLPLTDNVLSTRVEPLNLRPNFNLNSAGTPSSILSDPRTDAPRNTSLPGPSPSLSPIPNTMWRSRVPDISASSSPRDYDAPRDLSPLSRSGSPVRGDFGRLPDLPRRGGTLNR